MVLLHEAVQAVHEPLPGILGILEVDTHMNGFHGADLLAHPAEDAPELVDLVDDGIPIPLVVPPPTSRMQLDGHTVGQRPQATHLGRPSA